MHIHHIGYLVKNIDKARMTFEKLDYDVVTSSVYDAYRDADIMFLSKDGYKIELVSPHKTSNIYPLLKKYNNIPYHICYQTEDIAYEVKKFKEDGFLQFTELQPAPAISSDSVVIFLNNASIGMIELLQQKEK